jgi:hypothetical protein
MVQEPQLRIRILLSLEVLLWQLAKMRKKRKRRRTRKEATRLKVLLLLREKKEAIVPIPQSLDGVGRAAAPAACVGLACKHGRRQKVTLLRGLQIRSPMSGRFILKMHPRHKHHHPLLHRCLLPVVLGVWLASLPLSPILL